jgi:flagellar assembly protein FliH
MESGRLIKAHSVRSLGSEATFNYDDLKRQCDEHVAHARRQAAELLARAEAESSEIRRRAHEEGHAEGQKAGLHSAQDLIESRAAALSDARIKDHLLTALPPLEAIVSSLENERDCWLTVWESTAVRLSAAIAEKLVRNELRHRPELTRELVHDVLQLASGRPKLQLYMHPDDIEQLRSVGMEILEILGRVSDGALVPDESIPRGGCVAKTLHGEIDARIETQVRRIADELLGGI